MQHLSSGVVRERCHPEQPVGAVLPTPTGDLKLFQSLGGNLVFSEGVVTGKDSATGGTAEPVTGISQSPWKLEYAQFTCTTAFSACK